MQILGKKKSFNVLLALVDGFLQIMIYSARRLMGSRIIESAAYWNQISLAQVHINRAQNTTVN
jgi:hypothetical protein